MSGTPNYQEKVVQPMYFDAKAQVLYLQSPMVLPGFGSAETKFVAAPNIEIGITQAGAFIKVKLKDGTVCNAWIPQSNIRAAIITGAKDQQGKEIKV